MKISIDSRKTALLISDMQNDGVSEKGAAAKLGSPVCQMIKENKVVENIGRIIKTARKSNMPIFHTKMVHRKDFSDVKPFVTDLTLKGIVKPLHEFPRGIEGTWGAEVIEELRPENGDYVIIKRRSGAFYGTDLEILLSTMGIETLVVVGLRTDECVDMTVREAFNRNLKVIVLTDCVATTAKEIQEFWTKNVFPKLAVTMTSGEFAEILQ